jgi:hypothetical protein
MDRRKAILYIGVVVVIITLLVWLLSDSREQSAVTTSRNWEKKYDIEDDSPYGLLFFQEIAIRSGKFTVFDIYTSHKQFDSLIGKKNLTVLFIGEQAYLTYGEIDQLLTLVDAGCQLFLSLDKFPYFLLEDLLEDPGARFIADEKVNVKINSKEFEQYYIYNTDTLLYFWSVFEEQLVNANPQIAVHSKIDDFPNFISIPYGRGAVTLHLNPMFFVNYQLKRPDGYRHLVEVLERIVHDEIHYLAFAQESLADIDATEKTGSRDHSIIAEIFKYDSLKTAFIFFIFGAIIFFLFRAKRVQRTIPVSAAQTNGGIGFADTIAGIYYSRQNPNYLKKIMRRNFYENCSSAFYVDLKNRKSNKPVGIISQKANYPVEKINYLLTQLEENKKEFTTDRLLRLDRELRDFYIVSGAWSSEKLKKISTKYSNVYRMKSTSYGYVIAGLLTIIFGFVALSYAKGFGVLFWPIGIFLIYLGTKAMRQPILRINKKYIEIIPLLGKRKITERDAVKSIYLEGNILVFETISGDRLTVSLAVVSVQDRMQLTNLETKK